MLRKSIVLFLILIPVYSFSIALGTRISLIPWGTGETQLGLQSGPEIEPVGPLSFTVDSANSVYFLDQINKRISVFDAQGTHQKIMGNHITGSSIAVAEDGSVGVLQDKQIQILDSKAQAQNLAISRDLELTEGYGQHLRIHQNEFYATQLNQRLNKVAQRSGVQFQAVGGKSNKSELTGLPGKSTRQTYTVEWKNNNLAIVKSSSGGEYPLTTSDAFGGLQVIGEDTSGNIYIEAERITRDNHVHLDIWKLDSGGKVVAVQEIPNKYATTVYKKTELLNEGTVLQMITTKEGVEIWKWTF